jgi:general secretion pathway protein C
MSHSGPGSGDDPNFDPSVEQNYGGKPSLGARLKALFRRKPVDDFPPTEAATGGTVIEGQLYAAEHDGRGTENELGATQVDMGPIEPSERDNFRKFGVTNIVHVGELRSTEEEAPLSHRTSETVLTEAPSQEPATGPIDVGSNSSFSEAPQQERGESTQTRLRRMMNPQAIQARLSKIDYLAIADTAARVMHGRGYVFYGKLLTVLFCTFFLADVLALLMGGLIPEAPISRMRVSSARHAKALEDYSVIMTRNLFNHAGKIPGEEAPGGGAEGFDPGGAPIKTTLPFDLVGIVILRDPKRSIATIADKSSSIIYPIRVDEEIPGKARIVEIDPRRVIFVNLQSNRREFAELPEEGVNQRVSLTSSAAAVPGIEQVATNQFNIDRKEVDKALGDLNNIITQARAVPNFENGVAAGYKLFQIVPGSIYDKLGLKNGDVIAGFDGQPVTDPGQAFAALNGLKQRSNLDLQIKRDGKTQTFSYEIH